MKSDSRKFSRRNQRGRSKQHSHTAHVSNHSVTSSLRGITSILGKPHSTLPHTNDFSSRQTTTSRTSQMVEDSLSKRSFSQSVPTSSFKSELALSGIGSNRLLSSHEVIVRQESGISPTTVSTRKLTNSALIKQQAISSALLTQCGVSQSSVSPLESIQTMVTTKLRSTIDAALKIKPSMTIGTKTADSNPSFLPSVLSPPQDEQSSSGESSQRQRQGAFTAYRLPSSLFDSMSEQQSHDGILQEELRSQDSMSSGGGGSGNGALGFGGLGVFGLLFLLLDMFGLLNTLLSIFQCEDGDDR